MVSEGQLRLKMKPWKRRLLTRSVSIIPSIIVAGALGGPGVDKALVGSQVALSVILPFVSAPLVWFTMRGKYMTVTSEQVRMGQPQHARENEDGNEDGEAGPRSVNMRIHPVTAFFAVVIWGVIVIMNVALLVLLGLGKT
jgi:metal iron transporter